MTKLRILLADDQSLFREALRTLLALQPDFEIVGEAENGERALALAKIHKPDVVLMDDKPSKLVTALAISRKTMRIVRENIVFALAVKAVILALGALGIATMWLAVFGDVGVLILAVLNAMRTLNVKEFGAE